MPGVGPTSGPLIAFLDSPFLGPGLAFASALLAGAVAIALIRRWQRDTGNPVAEASDQLSHYRALRDRGAISEEEYQRLRRALTEDLKGGPIAPEPRPAVPPPAANGEGPPPETGTRPP